MLDLLLNINFWITFGVLAGIIAIGAYIIQRTTDGGPVYNALHPFIVTAILAAKDKEIEALQEFDKTITGADKAAIANSLYDLLPDTTVILGIPIPVGLLRQLVSRETFASWVKYAYDEMHQFIVQNENYLEVQVTAIVIPAPKSKQL